MASRQVRQNTMGVLKLTTQTTVKRVSSLCASIESRITIPVRETLPEMVVSVYLK